MFLSFFSRISKDYCNFFRKYHNFSYVVKSYDLGQMCDCFCNSIFQIIMVFNKYKFSMLFIFKNVDKLFFFEKV